MVSVRMLVNNRIFEEVIMNDTINYLPKNTYNTFKLVYSYIVYVKVSHLG